MGLTHIQLGAYFFDRTSKSYLHSLRLNLAIEQITSPSPSPIWASEIAIASSP